MGECGEFTLARLVYLTHDAVLHSVACGGGGGGSLSYVWAINLTCHTIQDCVCDTYHPHFKFSINS